MMSLVNRLVNNKILYTAEQTRQLDRMAITELGISGYTLMKRAGEALWDLALEKYPTHQGLIIFCGTGNNGGDGYVLAKLALDYGKDVQVIQVGKSLTELSEALKGEALEAYNEIKDTPNLLIDFADFNPTSCQQHPNQWLIVDAMLGTGLSGDVRGEFGQAITVINGLASPVLAVDIPSGLCADSGISLGHTTEADTTLTFIGINRGLVTANGANFTGQLYYSTLDLPERLFSEIAPQYFSSSISCYSHQDLCTKALKRLPASHKGHSGRVLVIGGNEGLAGAAILCSGAALRAGAGLVTVLASSQAVIPILTRYPEVMVRDIQSVDAFQLQQFIAQADAIVMGPGLNASSHSKTLLIEVLKAKKKTVLDADALNMIATEDDAFWSKYGHSNCVMTPHPKEAARLLACSIQQINQDRFHAIDAIVRKFNCTALLKGSGTIISNFDNNVFVCLDGNAEMAVGGMGDVLSGILGAIAIHEKRLIEATKLAVSLHAHTADQWVSTHSQRLLPTDLINYIKRV